MKTIRKALRRSANGLLRPLGQVVVNRKRLVDYSLHSYESYEEYKAIQTAANRRKIEHVWADEGVLTALCRELRQEFGQTDGRLNGICHGTRNGFEQDFLAKQAGFGEVIGTEISDTAERFPNTRRWDFHEVDTDWVQRFDFVYSNSLDHAWNPKLAVETWLNQLKPDGILALEHTNGHTPEGTSETDPFGVRSAVVPYVLCMWFGHDIRIRFVKTTRRKSDHGTEAVWLFLVRKTGPGMVEAREAPSFANAT